MNTGELKEKLIEALDEGADPVSFSRELEHKGVSFDFSPAFNGMLFSKLGSGNQAVARETEFSRNLNLAFRGIAISGVAVIILLLISIFLSDGSFSLNSFIGLTDSYDESIVCLLTGK